MKKLITIMLILLLFGCKKEEAITTEEPTVNCHCGSVKYLYGTYNDDGQNSWTYQSLNNCTNAPIGFTTYTEYKSNEYCLTYQW